MATDDLDPFARDLIHRKARRMVGRAGLTAQDRPDLEQELALRLLRALPRFDPDRAHLHAFVTTVVERAAAELFRRRLTLKRNAGVQGSLDAPAADEPEARRDGQRDADRLDLAADVAAVLATLPADLRNLAERLMRQTVAGAARDAGVPRSTLARGVQRLRRRFEDAGLGEYL